MNRAERRALARKGNAERMVATARDVIAKHVNLEATVTTYTIAAWVLHDKLGFGETRLLRFLDGMEKFATAINEGYTNVADMREELNRMYPGLKDAWEVRL